MMKTVKALLLGTVCFLGPIHAASSDVDKTEIEAACPLDPAPMVATRERIASCEAFIADQSTGAMLADALAAKARLHLNVMEREAAVASTEEALRIDPNHLDAGVANVDALLMLGRWADVRGDIEKLRRQYPDDQRVIRQYAQYVMLVGTQEDALAALEDAVAAAPEDLMLRHRRAMLLAGLGRTPEAIAELDRFLEGGPADGNLLSFRADLLLSIGKPEAAIADVEKAEQSGFRSGAARFVVARAELMLGRHEQALAALDAAAEDPSFRQSATLLPLYRFAVLDRLDRSAEAEEALAAFIAGAEKQFILRVQAHLRNMGFDSVEITGEIDEVTKDTFVGCLTARACGASISRAI